MEEAGNAAAAAAGLGIGEMIAAIAALGVAAQGLVDTSKFFNGGISRAGLGYIREALAPFGIELGLFTVIVGHATFCVVVVYNNAVARLRRMSRSFEEASADLGAHPFQTFRLVTLPQLRGALLAGGLLAFGLSFDEVIVTTFTAGGGVKTLPLWILENLFRPNQAPVVNVIAVVLVLVSIIPIYVAQRVAGTEALQK